MSELTERGVVTQILQEETGTSKAGKEWRKQEFVIETEGQYPKNICFTLFGDKIDLLMKIAEGMTVDVSFNLESREYNGRWFHSVNAWRIQPEKTEQQKEQIKDIPPEPEDNGGGDDLPF
jgi:hypothetical protein